MVKGEFFKELIPGSGDREELISLCKAFLRHYYKANDSIYHREIKDLLEISIRKLAWMNGLNVCFNPNYPDKVTFFNTERQFKIDALVGNIIEG